MKENYNKNHLSQKEITSIISEEADINDPYDCYELEQTMNIIQPYLTNLSEEQRTQIATMKQKMIQENVSPRLIRKQVMKKLRQFNIYIPTKEEILKTLRLEIIKQIYLSKQLRELRELGYSMEYINYLTSEENQQYTYNPFPPSFINEYLKLECIHVS